MPPRPRSAPLAEAKGRVTELRDAAGMTVWVVMVGCTDYYCHGAHLLVGVFDSEAKARSAPIPDSIDDNQVDTFYDPVIYEIRLS